jgi:hypothetical protein
MIIAAGSNFAAQEYLTRSMTELLGNFSKHSAKIVKKIIKEMPRQYKTLPPLTKLNLRL